jgi:adenylate cyclase
MAIAFLVADPHSPTSRPLCLFFGLLGATFLVNIPASADAPAGPGLSWMRIFSLLETGIMASAFEWILRIGRTEITAARRGERDDRLLRASQVLACLYGMAGVAFPRLRTEVWNVPWTVAVLRRPGYWVFAAPFNLSLLLVGVRFVHYVRAKLDHAEWLRLVALALATPFWCVGFFVPDPWRPVSFAMGEIIILVGAIRYHVLQGQRGQFLARFLSPQVVRLVRERGLSSTMQRQRLELTAVACDLRGFTAFAETAAPEEVMALLEAYYVAVGDAVIHAGGSITSFAGDGIVALLGAPIPRPDHAERAVAMAIDIRDRTGAILAGWHARGLDVGLGIGIASGFVTVGVIGGAARLEYTAVGPTLNLAARLCARAESGHILTDARVAAAVGMERAAYRLDPFETAELKGFARPVAVYRVAASTPETAFV